MRREEGSFSAIVIMDELIPPDAVRVHMYNVENVLRPRGHMKKESIGVTVLERLNSCYEEWTNSDYGDLPSEEELLKLLERNLQQEVVGAWKEFLLSRKGK
jgi:hypothetical protein